MPYIPFIFFEDYLWNVFLYWHKVAGELMSVHRYNHLHLHWAHLTLYTFVVCMLNESQRRRLFFYGKLLLVIDSTPFPATLEHHLHPSNLLDEQMSSNNYACHKFYSLGSFFFLKMAWGGHFILFTKHDKTTKSDFFHDLLFK